MNTEEYFKSNHINASGINCFINKGAKCYREMYVDQTLPNPPSKAMTTGSMLHCRMLEPEKFNKRYAVAPDVDMRTKVGKKAYADFCAQFDQEKPPTFVTTDQIDQVERMRQSLLSNQFVSSLFTSTVNRVVETPIVFETIGVVGKALLDLVLPGSQLIVDIKTTSSDSGKPPVAPSQFKRTVENFGYHRQAAWYRRAAAFKYGGDLQSWSFVFAVVDSNKPHDCAVYLASERLLAIADSEIDEAVADMVARTSENDFVPWYSKGMLSLEPSKYYVPYRRMRDSEDE
jgi:hypothetical protein